MRITSFLAFLVFASAALVQSNDPDPLPWVLAYGVAAVVAAIAGFARIPRGLSAAGAAMYFFAAWRVWPADTQNLGTVFDSITMASLGVEETRESLGMALVALWMVVLFVARGSRVPE